MQFEFIKANILKKLDEDLDPMFSYHSARHTRDVLSVCEESARRENLSASDEILLLTAAVLHDVGFLLTTKDHEQVGVDLARPMLPNFGYDASQIDLISNMILATKIPQSPKTQLEEILCDADLDYLGREDFYQIGNMLFDELKAQSIVNTEREWDKLQVKFLHEHNYHTDWSIKERQPAKEKYLKELEEKWN